MEKRAIFSVESSCSCFAGRSGCCDVQNNWTDSSNAFGNDVSQQISNSRAFPNKKWLEREFSMEIREFSLWSLRVLVSLGVQGAMTSTTMGQTDLMLLEAMFANRFPTVGLFHEKKRPEREFSMEKQGSFPVESSFSCFALRSGCCDDQNDGTD